MSETVSAKIIYLAETTGASASSICQFIYFVKRLVSANIHFNNILIIFYIVYWKHQKIHFYIFFKNNYILGNTHCFEKILISNNLVKKLSKDKTKKKILGYF